MAVLTWNKAEGSKKSIHEDFNWHSPFLTQNFKKGYGEFVKEMQAKRDQSSKEFSEVKDVFDTLKEIEASKPDLCTLMRGFEEIKMEH